ncbi:hypothetical protein DFQ13_104439 [Actinokineospora spheciospongiae]|nr:hypothetical protein DFQ13_104439 [Actinokineospora spheciospongiae]
MTVEQAGAAFATLVGFLRGGPFTAGIGALEHGLLNADHEEGSPIASTPHPRREVAHPRPTGNPADGRAFVCHPGSVPSSLTWADVDPAAHPFTDAAVARCAPAGDPCPETSWTDAMTAGLVAHHGPWVAGWRWARDEGEIGGGPITAWCCPEHSVTTPAETLARVDAAVREWRAWVERLAVEFDRHPLAGLTGQEWAHAARSATTALIALVVDSTTAGDAWYRHCAQVLTWYLTRWGVNSVAAGQWVEEAIGGRFGSWIEPAPSVLLDVAGRLSDSGP